MGPNFSPNDVSDKDRGDVQISREGFVCYPASGIGITRVADVFDGQFGPSVRFAFGGAALVALIVHIVSVRPEPMMSAVAAQWIIAIWAIVANVKLSRIFSGGQKVSYPWNVVVPSMKANDALAALMTARPWPACARAFGSVHAAIKSVDVLLRECRNWLKLASSHLTSLGSVVRAVESVRCTLAARSILTLHAL